MKTFVRKLRALADELNRIAGTEAEAKAAGRLARWRLFTGIAIQLHHAAHLLAEESER